MRGRVDGRKQKKNGKNWIRKIVLCAAQHLRFDSDKGGFERKSIRCTRSWLCGNGSRVPHSRTRTQLQSVWIDQRDPEWMLLLTFLFSFFLPLLSPYVEIPSCVVRCRAMCAYAYHYYLNSSYFFFVFSSFFLLRFHCYRFDCADFDGACVRCRIPYYFY